MQSFLREIENYVIRPKKKLIKGGRGNYKGYGLGQCMEFNGHRDYSTGDDLRRIDWKAYMRTNKFYIKEYTEERQMYVNVILDNSASMDFGKSNKLETGKLLALGIGYLTLKQADYYSLYTINEQLDIVHKNLKGKNFFYKLAEDIPKIIPSGNTRFNELIGLEALGNGMTFIISDFLNSGIDRVLDHFCSIGQEVVVIQTLSQLELNPKLNEELKLIDKETGEIRRIQFNKKFKETYINKIKSFVQKIQDMSISTEASYILASTDMSPSLILANVLGGA